MQAINLEPMNDEESAKIIREFRILALKLHLPIEVTNTEIVIKIPEFKVID